MSKSPDLLLHHEMEPDDRSDIVAAVPRPDFALIRRFQIEEGVESLTERDADLLERLGLADHFRLGDALLSGQAGCLQVEDRGKALLRFLRLRPRS